jgi:hypothetical protein
MTLELITLIITSITLLLVLYLVFNMKIMSPVSKFESTMVPLNPHGLNKVFNPYQIITT